MVQELHIFVSIAALYSPVSQKSPNLWFALIIKYPYSFLCMDAYSFAVESNFILGAQDVTAYQQEDKELTIYPEKQDGFLAWHIKKPSLLSSRNNVGKKQMRIRQDKFNSMVIRRFSLDMDGISFSYFHRSSNSTKFNSGRALLRVGSK